MDREKNWRTISGLDLPHLYLSIFNGAASSSQAQAFWVEFVNIHIVESANFRALHLSALEGETAILHGSTVELPARFAGSSSRNNQLRMSHVCQIPCYVGAKFLFGMVHNFAGLNTFAPCSPDYLPSA